MKKLISAILLVVVAAVGLSGCGKKAETVKIIMPDGSPAIAMAELMGESELLGKKLNFEIVQGADVIKSKVLSGEADVALIPANLAAILYNGAGGIRFCGIAMQGNLFLMGTENIASEQELAGKVVYNIGKGAVPDLVFRLILNGSGMQFTESDMPVPGKVALAYVSVGSDLIGLFKTGKATLGILAEPAVTQARANSGAKILLGIEELWAKVPGNAESFPQAVLAVKKELAETDPSFIEALIARMKSAPAWAAENAGQVAAVLKSHGSGYGNIAYDAEMIGRVNLAARYGESGRSQMSAFLAALHAMDPKFVGGKLPDDGFYF